MAGFVYVMSNPAMPGLVEIGGTDRLSADRKCGLLKNRAVAQKRGEGLHRFVIIRQPEGEQ